MTDDSLDDSTDETTETDVLGWRPSRRRLLESVGATGLIGGLGGLGLAQTQDQPVEIRLGGEVAGWTLLGNFRADFIGEGPNPTLNLEVGKTYEVFWKNLDGLPHNFAIVNSGGDYLVRSDIISEEGATQTVRFTAKEDMAEYLCEVHPNSMRGDIQYGAGAETPTPATPAEQVSFFEQGARVGAQIVAEGMTAPTDFAVANTDNDRRFVADQTGEVWIVTQEGRQQEPFINISDRMVELGNFFGEYADPQQDYDERGLLGIEFHPDFQNNRKFYLHYSAPPGGVDADLPADNWDHWEILSEFKATEDLSKGQPGSERRILEIPSPQYNHDSGPFAFGPDGLLYFPMGDGGGADDNMYGHVPDWYERNSGGNGQDIIQNLMGTVLRIDVDNQEGDKPYAIPDDNPFVGTQALPEIYAYGFRNPFGIDFDSDGNMFVADAGQNLWEEADLVVKGGNYGWNVKEGTHCFSTENPSDPTAIIDCPESAPQQAPYDGVPLRDPIVEYPHQFQNQSVGITIIGGHRYEQNTISELQGKYVYGAWTQDPARREPQGRVLTAQPPQGFETAQAQDGTAMNATNATNATGEMENATGQVENATGNETGNATQDQTSAERVPRGQLWDMAELQFAGTEDGSLPYFVRQFGQGADGEEYVLVSKRGIPEGSSGAVLKLVPPDQGEQLPTGTPTPAQAQTTTVQEPGEEPDNVTANETATQNETAAEMETPTEGANETQNETDG